MGSRRFAQLTVPANPGQEMTLHQNQPLRICLSTARVPAVPHFTTTPLKSIASHLKLRAVCLDHQPLLSEVSKLAFADIGFGGHVCAC
jgi:hypothetical protein